MSQNMPFLPSLPLNFNQIPTITDYTRDLGKHFLICHGYNLFGQFVHTYWEDGKDTVIEKVNDDQNRTVSLRLCLAETMIVNERDIPGIQEQFAVVAASYGWNRAHIDYRIFHPNLCRLSYLWLYTNLEPKEQAQCP